MAAAGLGLRLHDILYGSEYHRVFNNWWERAKELYGLGSITGTARDVSTWYYDPLIDLHFGLKAGGHINLCRELLGQKNEEARLLFNGAAEFFGWTNLEPLREGSIDFTTGASTPMATVRGLTLAKEFGENAIYAKLMAHAEENYEPTWDAASGELTWGFGLNEPHPRGQYNAHIMTAEACTPGALTRIYDAPNLRKFLEPTVYGVDFPTVCLSQAYYDVDRRCLVISMDSGLPSAAGQPTSFRVNNVEAQSCRVVADGQSSDDWRIVNGELEINTTVGQHTFVISQQWGGA